MKNKSFYFVVKNQDLTRDHISCHVRRYMLAGLNIVGKKISTCKHIKKKMAAFPLGWDRPWGEKHSNQTRYDRTHK